TDAQLLWSGKTVKEKNAPVRCTVLRAKLPCGRAEGGETVSRWRAFPLLLRFARHRWCIRVLHFEPIGRAAGSVVAQPIEKKVTTPYVTHFIFRPLMSIDIPGLGTATNLEAVGTTQNMKGEKMLDKMSARCAALSVASGDKKYIDGACVLTDSDGDQIFSTFDTRDTDKSQPQMNCGTISSLAAPASIRGSLVTMPALAGPGGYTAMDIPHNTTWEIK